MYLAKSVLVSRLADAQRLRLQEFCQSGAAGIPGRVDRVAAIVWARALDLLAIEKIPGALEQKCDDEHLFEWMLVRPVLAQDLTQETPFRISDVMDEAQARQASKGCCPAQEGAPHGVKIDSPGFE
jgi:hypothetical protein